MATKKASSTARAKTKPVATTRAKPKAKTTVTRRATPSATATPKKKTASKKRGANAPKRVAAATPAKTKPAAARRAASAPKRRSVPKVSPLKGTSVADWVKRLPPVQAAIVDTLLTLAASAAPDAKPVIKWAQPVFELSGPVAYIKASKAHVTLGFWRGTELDDPRGLLAGGDRMKHVRLASLADIDRATLSAWLAEAARLNRAQGDPTKRLPRHVVGRGVRTSRERRRSRRAAR